MNTLGILLYGGVTIFIVSAFTIYLIKKIGEK
jgi:hypothetical protein